MSENFEKRDQEPTSEEVEKFKEADQISAETWREQRHLASVENNLRKMGVTDEILDELGVDGVCEVLTDVSAEKVRAYLSSREGLQKSLGEKLEDSKVRTMIEFRLKNLKEALKENHRIEKERKNVWDSVGEHLGEKPVETMLVGYEMKLEEIDNQIKEIEMKDEMTVDEKNELKKIKAQKLLIENQIKFLKESTKKSERESGLEEREIVRKLQERLKELEEDHQGLRERDPEAFLSLCHRDFRRYTKDLIEGRSIAETPSVKRRIEEMVAHLKNNIPVLVYGHLGSGKTELALHLAKTRFPLSEQEKEKEVPSSYVISGSRHIVPSEFYGHQVLSVPSMDALEGLSEKERETWRKQSLEVEEEVNRWIKENPDASEEEKQRAWQTRLTTYCANLGKGTITDYVLGPVYKAMEEGRPLIIDEVNAIPHEVLISLNYILTRKTGEEISVQQDSGKKITIKKGFCIMMTGNLNQGHEKYEDRRELDPAFLSRLHRMEYDYLPQEKEGSLESERGPQNELYQLLLAKLADRNGNIAAPKETLRAIWKLSQAARVFQNVFAGKEIDSAYFYQEQGGRATEYMLQKSTLSLRELGRIISAWKGDNFEKELDYYIYNDFVKQAVDLNDRAYLYQVLQRVYGFFQGPNWEKNPNYGTAGKISSFDIEAPENSSGELQFFGPEDIIQAGFGEKPERKEWPEIKEEEKVEGEEVREVFIRREEIGERMREVKRVMPKELAAKMPEAI